MIGVFDSGIGGLGVLSEIRAILPSAQLIYVADEAHAPYGTMALEDVRRRSEEVAGWLIEHGSRVVTIACNTASAAALHSLRESYPNIAFVGMEPALKPATHLTGRGRVGVVATAATFQGELFASVVTRFASSVEVITAACPEWVDLVEAGVVGGPEAEGVVRRCLTPMLEAEIDVLVLACTHYPALRGLISEVLGPGVEIIDPAPAVAAQTARLARELAADDGSGGCWVSTTGPRGFALLQAVRRAGIESEPALLPWGRHGSS